MALNDALIECCFLEWCVSAVSLPAPQGKLDGTKPLEEVDNVSNTVKDVSALLLALSGMGTLSPEKKLWSGVTYIMKLCRVGGVNIY